MSGGGCIIWAREAMAVLERRVPHTATNIDRFLCTIGQVNARNYNHAGLVVA